MVKILKNFKSFGLLNSKVFLALRCKWILTCVLDESIKNLRIFHCFSEGIVASTANDSTDLFELDTDYRFIGPMFMITLRNHTGRVLLIIHIRRETHLITVEHFVRV